MELVYRNSVDNSKPTGPDDHGPRGDEGGAAAEGRRRGGRGARPGPRADTDARASFEATALKGRTLSTPSQRPARTL